jgi:hypothetical protein
MDRKVDKWIGWLCFFLLILGLLLDQAQKMGWIK